jgi:hypothetical protein
MRVNKGPGGLREGVEKKYVPLVDFVRAGSTGKQVRNQEEGTAPCV